MATAIFKGERAPLPERVSHLIPDPFLPGDLVNLFMTAHPFSFEVKGKNYTARFTIIEDTQPKEVHVSEISPPDYSPETPHIFIVNQESDDLNFALKDAVSSDFGVPISKAIIAACKTAGISFFDEIYHSGHQHDNSV